MSQGHRAAFFDRDGVVNASPIETHYVLRWEDFHFLPGLGDVLAWLKARGWKTVLVTNQQCVGLGSMSRVELDAIHARMQEALGPNAFDNIQVCDHLAGTCDCRKPSPVMVQRAAMELGIDLANSILIGDHDRDIQMARNAGVGTAIRYQSEKPVGEPAEFTVKSHDELRSVLERAVHAKS